MLKEIKYIKVGGVELERLEMLSFNISSEVGALILVSGSVASLAASKGEVVHVVGKLIKIGGSGARFLLYVRQASLGLTAL